ncbi:MAG: VTT domain-containing protein [Parvibaculum sp.]|uniref:VTT domain-containing protein n=1 Tax=Parvibaculum sp. TaxID=2024848 RepID=UPI0027291B3E|nr:VTT domain-containing protein [Parvibaculum sp.]MDO8840206.1 VTT domain-containing protein [Parvibaculum sp.]
MNSRRILLRAALAVAVAAAITATLLYRDQLDVEAVEVWLAGFGLLAPLVYLALYTVGTVAFLPGALFALAGGALFGPVWGALLNLAGATIGATLAFLVARYLAGKWVARRTGGRLKRLIEGVEAEGWRFVAFVRLVPLFPFNLTNYALGLTRIGLLSYVATSFIAMAPGAIAYTWLGHAGREALAGDASAIRYGLMALGLLAAIAFLPRLVRRLRGDTGSRWIDVSTLENRLATNGITLIDVREPDEFVGPLGHISGALNMPLGEIRDRMGEIETLRDHPVALVCRTDKRSASAAATLRSAGFRDVHVLRGGMEQWNRSGTPVEGMGHACNPGTAAETSRSKQTWKGEKT